MEHPILILGTLVAAAAILSIVFSMFRQSKIIAFIVVGMIAGLFREQLHIPHEMLEVFTEIGIILLLFMAGLEVDLNSFKKRWKVIVGNGTIQIFSMVVIGALIGMLLLNTDNVTTLIYFGLCLSLSSTIVVLSYLKVKKEMESLHGQIILGLMVIQDIVAVFALVFVSSLSGEGSLLVETGMVIAKLVGVSIVLVLLAKLVLRHIFKFLAHSADLMFLGSLGWVLGVAAACEAIHFSPEIGAFLAGGVLSILPYRLEIQDKVEPMKDFGIILFFVALGFELEITESAVALLGPIGISAAFVLFGTPIIMLTIGYFFHSKSRPAFMIGTVINQISEFSLILATLCLQAGIFNEETFLIITLATLVTLFFSSMGHQFIEGLYLFFKRPISVLDKHSSKFKRDVELEGFELRGHVVVAKYNELAEKVIEHFTSLGKRVLVLDIDPDIHEALDGKQESVRFMYADIYDPDTWEEAEIALSHLFVSCLPDGQEAELALLNWLKENNSGVPFIAATDSRSDALELYENGATYVIQTEDLAAERLYEIMHAKTENIEELAEYGKEHRGELEKLSLTDEFAFM